MKAVFAANASKSISAADRSQAASSAMINDRLNRSTRPWTSPEPLLREKTYTGKPPTHPTGKERGYWNTKLGIWMHDDPARNRQFHHTHNCGLSMRITEPHLEKPSKESYSMYLCPRGTQAGTWTTWRGKERSEAIRWKEKKPTPPEHNFTLAAHHTSMRFNDRFLGGASSAPSLSFGPLGATSPTQRGASIGMSNEPRPMSVASFVEDGGEELRPRDATKRHLDVTRPRTRTGDVLHKTEAAAVMRQSKAGRSREGEFYI